MEEPKQKVGIFALEGIIIDGKLYDDEEMTRRGMAAGTPATPAGFVQNTYDVFVEHGVTHVEFQTSKKSEIMELDEFIRFISNVGNN